MHLVLRNAQEILIRGSSDIMKTIRGDFVLHNMASYKYCRVDEYISSLVMTR